MPTEIEKLNSKYESLDKKVDKILFYLENDNKTNKKGLVQQVTELKTDIDEIKTKERVKIGKVGVISSILGAIGGFLIKYIF